MVEVEMVPDLYVDGIGAIDNLGPNFRTIYYRLAQPLEGGPLERVVTLRLVRPVNSLLKGSSVAAWLRTNAPEIAEEFRLHS